MCSTVYPARVIILRPAHTRPREDAVTDKPPASPASEPAAADVSRTLKGLQELVAGRPDGWEFLLFAAVLLQGKNDLELRWRDHQLRLPTADYHRLDEEEVAGYLGAAFGRLGWTLGPIERVFAAQEDAFGKPGEPGDVALIEHFAGWVIEVYRRLLDWAATVRSVDVPEEFELAVELASQAADLPLERIRSFIDETVAAVDQLPAKLTAPESKREPIELRLTLTLEADNELMGAAVDELRRVLGQEPDR
jgi:hypothetical protein